MKNGLSRTKCERFDALVFRFDANICPTLFISCIYLFLFPVSLSTDKAKKNYDFNNGSERCEDPLAFVPFHLLTVSQDEEQFRRSIMGFDGEKEASSAGAEGGAADGANGDAMDTDAGA